MPRPLPPDNLPRVNLSNFQKMDPHMLVGLINTELRNHCDSLDDLVKKHGIDGAELAKVLAKAGYDYVPPQNQFR